MGRWDDADDPPAPPPPAPCSASGSAPAPPSRAPLPSAAQRALAEAAAFAAARAAAAAEAGEEDGGGPLLASSPSPSSPDSGGGGHRAAAAATAVSGADMGSTGGGGDGAGRTRGPAASSRWADADRDAPAGGAPSVVGPAAPTPSSAGDRGAAVAAVPPPRPPPPPPQPSSALVSMLAPCRSVDCYERLAKIAEGAYGVVYKARDRESGAIVALKRIKMEGAVGGGDGFPLTSLREINILLACHHPSIVNVAEVVVGASLDAVYVAMEFCPHDLKGLATLMARPFTIAEAKCVARQLLAGTSFLHASWVMHRDIKPANVLVGGGGGAAGGVFKLADFGLARRTGSPPPSRLTTPVVTLYYRSPELLLGASSYGPEVDVWSLGCVLGELLLGRILFEPVGAAACDGEIAQMDAISRVLGPVSEDTLPGSSSLPGLTSMRYAHRGTGLRALFPAPGVGLDASARLSDAGVRLLSSMLAYDPQARITAADALAHPWFDEFPRATDPALMPTFPAGAAAKQ